MPKQYSIKELQRILAERKEEEPEEDLLILQPDGSRACLNWELKGQGFQVIDPNNRRKY
jgi:hypothetical protein